MKATLKKSEGLKKEFEVTVPAAEIQKRVNVELATIGAKAKIPGFRPGKIPADVLKKNYGANATNNALNTLVKETLQKTLTDNKVKPSLEPNVVPGNFEEGKDYTFSFSFEEYPNVPEYDFSKIKLTKQVVEVSETDVSDAIKRIADGHKHYNPIKTPRAAKKGDMVNFDFEGFKDGVAFQGGAAKGASVEIGAGQFIPGFEENLVGMNKGDEKTFDITFPADYHSKDLAGAKTQFKIKLNEILDVERHETFDDEFAKHMGFESLANLQEEIKKQISADYESVAFTKLKKVLFDHMDTEQTYEVPAGMVQMDMQSVLFQMKQETPDEDEAKLKAEAQKLAERRVRLGITLSEVGAKNKIQVTNDEIRQAIWQKAMSVPGSEQKVIEFYQKNPNALDQVKGEILEDKVVKFIISKASIDNKTVTREELYKEDDAEEASDSAAKPKKSTKKKS